MKLKIAAAFATVALALPAHAAGDAEAGEKEFNKCKACHMIESADETIVRGGKTGPNLYGIAGRTAGTYEDFRYSDLMIEAGEKGLAWNEEDFIGYVQDPTPWLHEYTGDSSGRGKMTFKVRSAEDAADLWAYLSSLAPES
ncbi:MAG: c-type cytochrome [Roseovarius sp.]